MNKQKQKITMNDVKLCQVAIQAVGKMAALKQVRKYPSAVNCANILVERFGALKKTYATQVGIVLYPGMCLFSTITLNQMRGWANQLFGFAYPAPQCEQWRKEMLKPINDTLERVEWLEKRK